MLAKSALFRDNYVQSEKPRCNALNVRTRRRGRTYYFRKVAEMAEDATPPLDLSELASEALEVWARKEKTDAELEAFCAQQEQKLQAFTDELKTKQLEGLPTPTQLARNEERIATACKEATLNQEVLTLAWGLLESIQMQVSRLQFGEEAEEPGLGFDEHDNDSDSLYELGMSFEAPAEGCEAIAAQFQPLVNEGLIPAVEVTRHDDGRSIAFDITLAEKLFS